MPTNLPGSLEVSIEGDNVMISYKMSPPVPSSTGKAMILYSTRGFIEIPGRPGEGLSINHTAKRKDWRAE